MEELSEKLVAAVRKPQHPAAKDVGTSLKALREIAGLTQKEMAQRLGVRQAAVSKIENRGDPQISSLQKYVEALGATLRIDVTYRPGDELTLHLSDRPEENGRDPNQLQLPLLGPEATPPQRDIVLSIHPRYSDKILEGKKTVELRRRFPTASSKGSTVYIYSTSPVRAMVALAEIRDVVKLPVATIWQRYAEEALINKDDFDAYFSGVSEGFALMFSNVRPLRRPLDLTELRDRFGFKPPQSFLYAKPVLRRALAHEHEHEHEHEHSDVPY